MPLERRILWPAASGAHKFVQLYWQDQPFLRFGPVERSHSDIVERFFRYEGVPYERVDGLYVPLRDEGYSLAGAGMAGVHHPGRVAVLGGYSSELGMGLDDEHFLRVRGDVPGWFVGKHGKP